MTPDSLGAGTGVHPVRLPVRRLSWDVVTVTVGSPLLCWGFGFPVSLIPFLFLSFFFLFFWFIPLISWTVSSSSFLRKGLWKVNF